MPRACAIHMDALSRDDATMQEVWPLHWTTKGRLDALKRHCTPTYSAGPSLVSLKVLDLSLQDMRPEQLGTTSSDPYIGYGRWQIKKPGVPLEMPVHVSKTNWWGSEHNLRFIEWMVGEFQARRKQKIADTPSNQGLYCKTLAALVPVHSA